MYFLITRSQKGELGIYEFTTQKSLLATLNEGDLQVFAFVDSLADTELEDYPGQSTALLIEGVFIFPSVQVRYTLDDRPTKKTRKTRRKRGEPELEQDPVPIYNGDRPYSQTIIEP